MGNTVTTPPHAAAADGDDAGSASAASDATPARLERERVIIGAEHFVSISVPMLQPGRAIAHTAGICR